jgi:gliding motility-associated-like protein
MTKTLPLFIVFSISFLLLSTVRLFAQTSGEIITFNGKSERFLVFLEKELETVTLCGLEPGEDYLLNVIPAYAEDGLFMTFQNLQVSGLSYGKLKAAQSCMPLAIKTEPALVKGKIRAYISVSRAGETVSVKPPVSGIGRPPAITTSTGTPTSQLITNVLIGGDCFEVSGVTAAGTNNQRGTFANGSTSIGLSSGVILSTGNIATASGPNNSGNAGTNMNQNQGDPDLQQLSGSNVIRDVSKIEFNFTPTNDTVTFRYVFASEEYCEWVGSGFNDVFGFFISGPGISGPFSNNAQNIAVLPNGTQVSINNVNHNTNSAFYDPNIPAPIPNDPDCNGHPVAGPPSTLDCQYDGFTVVLTATAIVIPCSTYHIKLAVGDVGDYIYDSAVFLEANSFSAGTLASAQPVGTVQGTNIIYEGCTGGYFLFTRDGDLSEPMTITYTIGGTATPGSDYEPITVTVTIPAGESSVQLPINAVVDNIAEGAETITLTFALPCQCSEKVITMQIQDPPPINLNLDDQNLCGAQSVTLNPGASGGVPGGLTYNWSTGATSPSITVNPPIGVPTTYSVTVTDACGNTATENATVTINETPTASLSGSGVLCSQGNSDPVELTVNFTGTAPWTFVYSQNGQQQTVTTSSNPYTLTVSNPGTVALVSIASGNCQGTVSGNVNIQQINITASTQTNNPDCNGSSDGAITLTASGGTSPYSFIWSNGSTSQNPTGLPAGTYTVTITDANGCAQTATATLTNPPQLNASVTNTQQVDCNHPTGSITTSVSGGTPGYTYQWSPSGSGANPSGLPSGTYNGTVTDANGCTVTITATINEDITEPSAAASVSGILTCTTTSLTLSGSGSSTGGNFTYQWSGPGIVSGGNTLNPVVNAPGNYTITVTNTSNGCTETATVNVPQNITPPVAAGTAPPITCNNPQVTISGAGSSTGPNFTYQWNGPGIVSGGTTLNPVVNAPGNYTLTVTNTDNGCTANTNVNVPNQTQLPNVTATSPTLTCTVTSVTLNGAGSSTGPNFTYQWTGPGIVSGATTLNPVVNQPGSYTLTVTNTTTGCVNSFTLNVPQNIVAPTAEAGPPAQIDCGSPIVQLNGAGSSAGPPGYSYQWSGPGIVGGGNTLNPNVNQPGTYSITVTNTSNGCTSTDQVNVTQDITPPVAVVAQPPTITCAVPQVQLNGAGSSTGPNFSYNWTTQGGIIVSGGNTLNPTVGAGGLYTLTVTNTNNDCTATFGIVVPSNTTPPVANAGPVQELTCVINQVQLIGANSSSGPNFTYQWTTPNGNIVSGANTLFPIANAPGTYTLTVTNNTNGCTSTSTTSVIVDENVPIANAGQPATITCVAPVVSLNGAGSSVGPNFTYQWSTTNGNIVSGATTLTPMVNLPGQYQLVVTSLANGCQSSSFVTVNQNIVLPTVSIAPPGEVNCYTPQVTINASASSNQGNYSYVWNTSNGNIVSGQGTLTPVVDQGGSYILTIVNNANGCINGGGVNVPEDIDNPALVIAPAATVTCTVPQVTLITNGSSNGPNFQYTWTTQDGEIVSGANTPNPVVSSGGTYSLTIYNQANNCSSEGQVVVPEDVNLPTVAVSAPSGLNCTVQSVQLAGAIGNGANLSYTWSTADGNFVSGQNTLQPVVDEPGTYLLEVLNPATGCENASTITVAEDAVVPVADAGGTGLLTCAVTSLELDGAGSDTGPALVYQWTTPNGNIVSGSQTTTPEIDAPGTYILQVYNTSNTCVAHDTVLIDEDVAVPVAAAAQPILMGCADPVVTLDGTASSAGPDIVYEWTTPNGNIANGANTLLPQVDAPGSYTLTALNAFNGCFSETTVTVVQDIELPVVDAGPGGELTCTLITIQLQGTASGQVNRFIYQWTTPDGNIISGPQTLTPVVNEPGMYTLVVTDTVNACVSEATVEITQDANVPEANVEPSNPYNCVFSTVTLDGTGSSQSSSLVYAWSTPNGNFVSGTETLTPVVDMPGTYTLTINDTINFCVTSQTVQILPDTVAPPLAIAAPEILNCYQPEISLSATAGGLTDIAIAWTTPDGNITANGNTLNPSVDEPGVYVLTVTNNLNGCTSVTETPVNSDFAIPLADAGPTGVITCADTVLTLSGSGDAGGAPMDFQWTTTNGNILSGADTPLPLIDQGGAYLLTLTNTQNGCLNTASVVIDQNVVYPIANAGPEGLLNCYNPQIQLNGGASSTGSIYAYEWTTADGNLISGGNTLTPSVDGPGTYLLTITDLTNQCVSTSEVLVLDDFIAPQADAGPGSELTCSITSIALSGSGSQGGNFTYSWTTTDGSITSGGSTLSPTVNAPGVYELLIFNQENGCSTTDQTTITTGVSYPVAAAGTANPLTCAVTSIQLNAAGTDTGPNFVYNWTTSNGNISTGGNTLTPVVNLPGVYTLSVTNTNNDCVTTAQVTVPIDTISPAAEAGPASLLTCAVTSLQLSGAGSSAGPSYTYQWTTGDGAIVSGATTLAPTINAPGAYQILVTNQVNGCTSADNVTIGQDVTPPLAAASTPGILTCAVPNLTLSGSGSSTGSIYTYTWTTPDGNIVAGANTLAPQVDQPGQYNLLVFNQFNGCSTATSVDVDQNIIHPTAEAGATADLTCAVTSMSLGGSASGNSSNLGYLWTTANGNILSGANTLAPLINQPGLYLLTVTDLENGCVTTDQVQIGQNTVPPLVLIANPGILTCAQQTVTLDAMASSNGAIFSPVWTTANGNILSGTQSLSPVVDEPGSYVLTITNAVNGCSTTQSVPVVQDIVQPTVDAGEDFTLPCFDDIAYLQGSVIAATNNLQYAWTTTGGQIASGAGTLTPAVSSGGLYQLSITNLVNGCSAVDEVVVIENIPANPQFVPAQPPCFGDKGVIQVTGVTGGTPPYVFSIDGGSTFQSNALFVNLNPGWYSVVVQDALGCETTPEAQYINAPEPVEVELGGIVTLQLGESWQLQAFVNFPDEEIQEIVWTPGDWLSCTDCLDPVASPLQSIIYQVEVTTELGCRGASSVQLILDKRPAVYIPNIFSPNGDGENDIFMIFAKPEGVKEVKSFLVFSRWGETVYEYTNFQPNNPAFGWDGKHRGQPMDPAVFAWFAEIEFIDGRTELFEGDVTLIR